MRRFRGRFDDDELLDRLLASMVSRVGGTSAAMAVADVLIDYACAGLRPCDSPKGSPRMLRRWQHFEDRITEELARSAGMRATARDAVSRDRARRVGPMHHTDRTVGRPRNDRALSHRRIRPLGAQHGACHRQLMNRADL